MSFKKQLSRLFLCAAIAGSFVACQSTKKMSGKNNKSATNKKEVPTEIKFGSNRAEHDVFIRRYRIFQHRSNLEQKDTAATRLFNEFMAPIKNYKDSSIEKALDAVDRRVNLYLTYTEDSVLYNKNEFWATSGLTIKNKKGDCEDYGFLKHDMMKALGIDESRLSVAVVTSFAKYKTGDRHAILVCDVGTSTKNLLIADDYPADSCYKSRIYPLEKSFYDPLYATHGKKMVRADQAGLARPPSNR